MNLKTKNEDEPITLKTSNESKRFVMGRVFDLQEWKFLLGRGNKRNAEIEKRKK